MKEREIKSEGLLSILVYNQFYGLFEGEERERKWNFRFRLSAL
jgi:hypothetical protein